MPREQLEQASRGFSIKFLLGVLNSSVARQLLRANRRSNVHLYPDDWKQLPIPDVSLEQQQAVISLVDRILAANDKDEVANLNNWSGGHQRNSELQKSTNWCMRCAVNCYEPTGVQLGTFNDWNFAQLPKLMFLPAVQLALPRTATGRYKPS